MNQSLRTKFEKEQFNNQANLVYINTMIICSLMSVIYFFLIGNWLTVILNLIAVLVSGLAIWLNRNEKYGVSSLIFISYISFISLVQIRIFGLTSGFQYYFFNLAGLIMFTSWNRLQKLAGVLSEAFILIVIFLFTYGKAPLVELDYGMIAFLHSVNAVLNIAGVANSANYYISISTKNQNQIMEIAMKDYLTNLVNRTSFDEYINEVFLNRKKRNHNIGILLLDIDNFKVVNDTCGHLCGDELLKRFSEIIANNIRTSDCGARYGGEEFIIVTTVDKPSKLEDFAERLRHQVEKMDYEFGGEVRPITVSIGALFITSNAEINKHQALDKADKLLYQAKNEGRNRVVFDVV